jgi:hypothetical protein
VHWLLAKVAKESGRTSNMAAARAMMAWAACHLGCARLHSWLTLLLRLRLALWRRWLAQLLINVGHGQDAAQLGTDIVAPTPPVPAA